MSIVNLLYVYCLMFIYCLLFISCNVLSFVCLLFLGCLFFLYAYSLLFVSRRCIVSTCVSFVSCLYFFILWLLSLYFPSLPLNYIQISCKMTLYVLCVSDLNIHRGRHISYRIEQTHSWIDNTPYIEQHFTFYCKVL